jgi:acyl dehydratase
MALDPQIVGNKGEPTERFWTSNDSLLYSLAVGAGLENPRSELEYTTENSRDILQKAIPSFVGVLIGQKLPASGNANLKMLLHAEQAFTLHKPLATAGTLRSSNEIKEVWDKGSGGLLVLETELLDLEDSRPLATMRSSLFIRGDGGFGGPKQPATDWELPSGKPDYEVAYGTSVQQALLYRLTGDRNPLHSDPAVAQKAGFDTPILHGMCSYGFTCRALLHTVAENEPENFESMAGRFVKSVFPGDILTVSIWRDGKTARFQTRSQDDSIVIDRGTMTIR